MVECLGRSLNTHTLRLDLIQDGSHLDTNQFHHCPPGCLACRSERALTYGLENRYAGNILLFSFRGQDPDAESR